MVTPGFLRCTCPGSSGYVHFWSDSHHAITRLEESLLPPSDCADWEVFVSAALVSELPEEEDPPQAVKDAAARAAVMKDC